MDSDFSKFFKFFIEFLKVDATASLLIGRRRELLLSFYKTYVALNKDTVSFKSQFYILRRQTALYLKEYQMASYKINVLCPNNAYPSISQELLYANENISFALIHFIKATEEYTNFRNKLSNDDLNKIYIHNVSIYFNKYFDKTHTEDFVKKIESEIQDFNQVKNAILKQALMEFFNALSHLVKAICIKNSSSNNVDSFVVHLYRGSLDYYKAIIKDIAFIFNLEEKEINELVSIRQLEYANIGNSLQREEILNSFKNFTLKLIQSKFF